MSFLTFLEYAGAVAFSLSGAFTGVRRKMDIFGVMILAAITTTGGGMMRDLIMGSVPPLAFTKYNYIMVAFITSLGLLVYFKVVTKQLHKIMFSKMQYLINFFDAVGLGIYTITSIQMAVALYPTNTFLCVSVGVIAGVGGGILRDIIANQVPLILRNELYALPAIIGGLIYYYMSQYFDITLSLYFCASLIFLIRIVSLKYHWHMPVVLKKINREYL